MTSRRTPDSVRRLMANIQSTFQSTSTWLSNAAITKSIRELKRRVRNVEERYSEYTALSQELLLLDPDESGETALQVEEEYLMLVSRLETLLDEMEPDPSGDGTDYQSVRSVNGGGATQGVPSVVTRLPKLQMPQFDGNPTNWASFIQRFQSAVSSPHLTDLNRLEHLLACVKGDAASLLENYQVLAENYGTALKVLRDRYENKRLLLRLYLQKLFQLPQVTNNGDRSLRDAINATISNVRAIENLQFKRDSLSNELLAQLVISKLDNRTRELWETHVTNNDVKPSNDNEVIDSYSDLIQFLENRLRVVSSVFASSSTSTTKPPNSAPSTPARTPVTKPPVRSTLAIQAQPASNENTRRCPLCSKPHSLYQCDEFHKLSVDDRYSKVRDMKICVNCFSHSHWSKQCKSIKCKTCGRLHHTLLHPTDSYQPSPSSAPYQQSTSSVPRTSVAPSSTQSSQSTPTPNSSSSTVPSPPNSTTAAAIISAVAQRRALNVLLSTAVVQASSDGHMSPVTALLDGASHITLITTSLANQLQLQLTHSTTTISGVAGQQSVAVATASIRITSRDGEFSKVMRAIVVDRITDPLPSTSFEIPASWKFSDQYYLANPEFNRPQPIDILIGADYLYDILLPDMQKLRHAPTLLSSHLGWLVAGPYSAATNDTRARCLATTVTKVEIKSISSFLGLEEPSAPKDHRTADEVECEAHYARTYQRDTTGRFILSLPRRTGVTLGESRSRAIACLKRTKFTPEYIDFLNEYEALGHMTRCEPPQSNEETYYMSHHAVWHNGKIRVVFNASMPTSNGVSLNDSLLIGPVVQNKLSVVITLFRRHRFAFSADMTKMYRQLLRAIQDRNLQRIVVLLDHTVTDYQLNTVTYGQSSAPYEATRSVVQLANDGKAQFPAAAEALLQETYMDDCCSGAYELQGAVKLRDELTQLLQTAGIEFAPSKWRSNHPDLLPEPTQPLSDGSVLGLHWSTTDDVIDFRNLAEFEWNGGSVTRRNAYSFVSRIFDPLGFLSPLTIAGKLLIQKLWNGNRDDWDLPIDDKLEKEFEEIRRRISAAATLSIPRYLGTDAPGAEFEIYGSGDASTQAYAACVYVRSIHNDNVMVRLVHAKTRVAPLSQIRTVPQLELCAADLLTELLQEVTQTLCYPIERCFVYTDSTIVLAYLAKEPGHWKPFEANRVRRIQSVIPREQWRHIPGDQNPADLATRDDSFPAFLQRQNLWIYGPDLLQSTGTPEFPTPSTNEAVVATVLALSVAPIQSQTQLHEFDSIFHRFSRYDRLKRAIGYVFRFSSMLLASVRKERAPKGPLTIQELDKASRWLIRVAQAKCFSNDLESLCTQTPLPKKSRLNSLDPRLEDGILCVGGRLENSELPYEEKHQIILLASHRLTLLLTRDIHYRYFHVGIRFITNVLQKKYWIIGNFQLVVQKCVRTCARCIRYSIHKPEIPVMGNLPATRVTVSMPFLHIGVDYAGPILTRSKSRVVRGPVPKVKSYFAVFVCMATKAAHIEAVSEATTAAFLATLRRFVARRGLPKTITSDNGSNFVGADAEIQRQLNELAKDSAIQNFSTELEIVWKFNPPSAPHMGGLYEAAVKSVKHHFKRVMGNQLLTFEEFATFLCQVEAILNSRPLAPLVNFPGEVAALTPAHFLIGRSLIDFPGEWSEDTRLNYRERWHLLQQLRNSFWAQWSRDYLRTLQHRYKWQRDSGEPFRIGDIVLLADDTSAPLVWPLGLIIKTYTGSHGMTRVVDVRTRNGTILRRPVVKLVRLVSEEDTVSTSADPSTAAGCLI